MKGPSMKKTKVAMVAVLLLFLGVIAGCGGGGGSGDGGGVTPGTELELFADTVRACTPDLEEPSPSTGDDSLEDWDGWDPGATGTVMGKLFDPGIGADECIHAQTEVLDTHIALVNAFFDVWKSTGSYTKGGITAVVDTSVTTVVIPFLNIDSKPVERLITLNDPAQGLSLHMAFSQRGRDQTVVSQYVQGEKSGVYYAWVEGSTAGIWHASVGDRRVQVMWEGNTELKTFKISACTDAADLNWEVTGGGSIASPAGEMAFVARNNVCNDSEDRYYLSTTYQELLDGDEPAASVRSLAADPPDYAGVFGYIDEDNASLCLGFLGEYPASPDDLAWD